MSKRKPIDVGALQAVAGTAPKATDKVEAAASGKVPSRVGKVQVAAWVSPALRTRVKVLAAELERPIGDLVEESLTELLAKHGK